MSSDEDEPAPSPSAAVVARRASREAKSMREESGSDEDVEEPEKKDSSRGISLMCWTAAVPRQLQDTIDKIQLQDTRTGPCHGA